MLSVSFSLALVIAMLFGIILPGNHKEVDKFNGQTREPIPAGEFDLMSEFPLFKGTRDHFLKAKTSCVGRAASGHRMGKAFMTAKS